MLSAIQFNRLKLQHKLQYCLSRHFPNTHLRKCHCHDNVQDEANSKSLLLEPVAAPRRVFTVKIQHITGCNIKHPGLDLFEFLCKLPILGNESYQFGFRKIKISIIFMDLDTRCILIEIECQGKLGPPFELVPTEPEVILAAVLLPLRFVSGWGMS
jgi:hypothetical protein